MITTSKTNTKVKLRRRKRIKRKINFVKQIFKPAGAKFGGILLLVIILACVFAPFITPYSPYEMDIKEICSPPSLKHICGTDELGRDLFSRILYGGRFSMLIGVGAAGFAAICGIILGCIAGYLGGKIDNLIMRFCDIWMSIPGLLLSLLIASSLGTGFFNTILALSVGPIPMGARIIRSQILAERSKEYIEAAEITNCSKTKIMFSHLLPNVVAPIIVSATMQIGGMITMAAGLSYLGFGIQPPTPEWGALLSEGTKNFGTYPYMLIYPGIALALCVLAWNLVGDGLRDALDPKVLG